MTPSSWTIAAIGPSPLSTVEARIRALLEALSLKVTGVEVSPSVAGMHGAAFLVSSHSTLTLPELRDSVRQGAAQTGADLALLETAAFRTRKRLLVFDLDSTLIQNETIDEFAQVRGVHERVQAITESAMRGERDFVQALTERVALLKGLTLEEIDAAYARIRLTPGAAELVAAARALGCKTAVLSGGFTAVTSKIRDRLGLDEAASNTLEFDEGKATGRLTPPIMDSAHKAKVLVEIAIRHGIPLDQVIAVGDGANDLAMLERAGLGIAFNAKPKVQEKAAMALNLPDLRSVLYLMGLQTESEWAAVL